MIAATIGFTIDVAASALHRVLDLVNDRNEWKTRALKAEARLKDLEGTGTQGERSPRDYAKGAL